ncbi:MAG: class I SAM-dependent methyltransferase [Dehalococcoidia bacterium]|nr:class I SAM-dependent methyltransferase [Dehalococcoidia bacterium]
MYRVESVHWWYRGMWELSSALLDSLGPNGHRLRVLDAGCGTAGTTDSLRRYGSVVGIDYSPLALELGRTRDPGLNLLCGTISKLPFADASFDLVTSFDVLYHLGVEDDLTALREFYRVLTVGGVALVRVPALEFLRARHDEQVHTRHRYTLGEVKKMVAAAGFRVIRSTYANMMLLPPVAAMRLWQRVTGEHEGSDLETGDGAVGGVLRKALSVEAALVRRGVDLPLGLSAVCLARKSG